ncbi:GNAT family N-acetyltransferase [Phenylobacterium sp.]|jgi:RimJ/RimL family protein N-acetyltransferase|uniref:GNAT family N-acetyltransferase n=1 Tax=Phenylobacterium sp. TaxID=1871053 RepID=UPI002F40A372
MGELRTSRLIGTRIGEEDRDDLVRLHLDEDVSRFLGGTRSADVTAEYLATQIAHWNEHGFGLLALKTLGGEFVGRAGLRYTELEGEETLEIAYTLARPFWGQGLATEIAQALVDHWRAVLADPSLLGLVMKGHVASDRVLLKTGFGYERDADFHGARISVFRMDRSWLNRPSAYTPVT